MFGIYLIILIPLILIGSLFVLDYYVFFWGNYLFDLISSIFFIGLAISELKKARRNINERKNFKLKLYNKRKSKKEKNKKKIQPKSVIYIAVEILSSILMIVITVGFIAKDFFVSSFDLSNVINKNFIKISCLVEESTRASSKGDHHSQYLIVKDLQNNNVLEINFRYKYERIKANKEYVIWYLPHSHLGYKAEPIN